MGVSGPASPRAEAVPGPVLPSSEGSAMQVRGVARRVGACRSAGGVAGTGCAGRFAAHDYMSQQCSLPLHPAHLPPTGPRTAAQAREILGAGLLMDPSKPGFGLHT